MVFDPTPRGPHPFDNPAIPLAIAAVGIVIVLVLIRGLA